TYTCARPSAAPKRGHEGIGIRHSLAGQALYPAIGPVDFYYPFGAVAGCVVQSVDVLRHQTMQASNALKQRDRSMRRIGHRRAEDVVTFAFVIPILDAFFLRGD